MEEAVGYASLQKQVLASVIPLLDTTDLSARDKYEMYMQLAQTQGGSVDLFQKAFQAAQSIEGKEKVGALIDLLSEIGITMQSGASSNVSESDDSGGEDAGNVEAPVETEVG